MKKRITKNKEKKTRLKSRNKSATNYDFVWIAGLIMLFSVLWVFKVAKFLPPNEFYFIGIIISSGIFYIGAFLSVKQPYKRSGLYIKQSLNYLYLTVILFVLFAVAGFVFSENLRFLDEILKQLILKTQGLNIMEITEFIFFNNIEAAFFGLFLGMLFGIYSFFNILSNGIVLGYVFSKLVDASKLTEFWRILPYGIFELPAIFISLALGIKLGMFIFSKEKIAELKIRFKESLIVFVFCVIPLLITAAIIEGVLISFFSNLS